MIRDVSYNDLFAIHQDIVNITHNSPALTVILGNKFTTFLEQNKEKLDVLHTKLHEFKEKYVLKNDKGEFDKIELDGKKEWRFKPNITDSNGITMIGFDAKTEYYRESGDFLTRNVSIRL